MQNELNRITLASMHARRGLILVAIHLAIAIPMILLLEISNSIAINQVHHPAAKLILASQETRGTVTFDPCTAFIDGSTVREDVVRLVDLPAFIPTGWKTKCPPRWTVASGFGLKWGFAFSQNDLPVQRRLDLLFIVLIALQWFLVGSFPLRPSARILAQPEWFITISGAVAAAMVWIPPIQEFSRFPALLALCGWLWFAGLILWRISKRMYRLVTSPKQTQSA